ncbi:hypothetical protein TNCV_2870291 [Trichonephila clavipes]|nr:hypothetical protein TNCV_2870291 [Trichonephila clavipes]
MALGGSLPQINLGVQGVYQGVITNAPILCDNELTLVRGFVHKIEPIHSYKANSFDQHSKQLQKPFLLNARTPQSGYR